MELLGDDLQGVPVIQETSHDFDIFDPKNTKRRARRLAGGNENENPRMIYKEGNR